MGGGVGELDNRRHGRFSYRHGGGGGLPALPLGRHDNSKRRMS